MHPSEPPPSQQDAPTSSTPSSRPRLKWPITEIVEDLRDLSVLELADVKQFVKRIRAARGDSPSPELVSQIVDSVERLRQTYPDRVPITLIRAGLANVPRGLLDQALFMAEKNAILRLESTRASDPVVETGAGIPHKRGLLYWIVPFTP